MNHDDRADKACAEAERSGPAVLQFVVGIQILDIEGAGEIITQIV
jgi:hypothetical protein